MVRWAGDNLWRRRDATDTVLLHLTRRDLGEEVRLRTTVDAKSGVTMACLWIQVVAGGHRPCCNAYGAYRVWRDAATPYRMWRDAGERGGIEMQEQL